MTLPDPVRQDHETPIASRTTGTRRPPLADPVTALLHAPAPRSSAPADTSTDTPADRRGGLHRVQLVHSAGPVAMVALVDLVVLAAATLLVTASLESLVSCVVVVAAGIMAGTYADRDTVETQGVLWYPQRVIAPIAAAGLLSVAAGVVSDGDVALLVLAQLTALVALRSLTWLILVTCRRRGAGLLRTLVIGGDERAALVVDKLTEWCEAGLRPVAVRPFDIALDGDDLCLAVRELDAQHVVLIPQLADDVAVVTTTHCQDAVDATFSMVPPMSDLFLNPARVEQVGGLPLVSLGRALAHRTGFPGKRAFDVVVAGILLLLVSPVIALAALAIKREDGGRVFYCQSRVGRGGRPFAMVKLRSMVPGAHRQVRELDRHNVTDGLLFKVPQDPRVTRVGRVLRRLSIDELPQLWNVVRGDMSLVGPRPLPVSPTAFTPVENRRHTTLPGITGYWQISGGNGLTYQEMIKLDLAYIRNWSLWLDIRLLARTIPALLHRHGTY